MTSDLTLKHLRCTQISVSTPNTKHDFDVRHNSGLDHNLGTDSYFIISEFQTLVGPNLDLSWGRLGVMFLGSGGSKIL